MRSSFLLRPTVLILASIVLFACVKKRPEMAAPGSGLETGETVTKSSLHNRRFALRTLDQRGGGRNSSAALLTVESGVDFINNYHFVNYETDAPLVGQNLDIKAEANNPDDYSLLFEIEGLLLKIYKVAESSKIPFGERTYAKPLHDGKLAVPVIAYNVTHFQIQNQRNSDNRETNVLVEVPFQSPERLSQATHIGINEAAVQVFEAQNKQDMFPTEWLLQGEWMFSAMQVGASDNRNSNFPFEVMGYNRDGFLSRVRFRAERDHLFAESLNIDDSRADKTENYIEILKIPVANNGWGHFEVRESIYGRQFREENICENENNVLEGRCPFVSLDLLNAEAQIYIGWNSFRKIEDHNPRLSEVIVSPKMLSWVIQNDEVKIRYNLTKYEPESNGASTFLSRGAHFEDTKDFGIFKSFRRFEIDNAMDNTQQNVYDNYRLNRLAPGQRVVYHPTGEAIDEPWVNEIGVATTRIWNQLFAKAYEGYEDANGEPIEPPTVEWSPEPVRRGDPRYFKMNFTAQNNTRTPGGMGPPYTDPKTGQIHFATSHIYVAGIKNAYRSFVYNYLKSKSGLFDESLLIETGHQFRSLPSNTESHFDSGVGEGGFLNYIPSYFFNPVSLSSDGHNHGSASANAANDHWYSGLQEGLASSTESGRYVLLRENTYLNQFGEETPFVNFFNYYDDIYTIQDHFVTLHHRPTDLLMTGFRHEVGDMVSTTYRGLVAIIEQECPEIVEMGRTITLETLIENPDEEVIFGCADRAVKHSILKTTVHELGHNFGLAHNFFASADENNHITDEYVQDVFGDWVNTWDTGERVNASSIMDYTAYTNPQSALPGPYDLAAIRFSHTGRVLSNSGSLISVVQGIDQDNQSEITVPIEVAMDNAGTREHNFLFCSERDVRTGFDPMCAKFDRGSTPGEVVDNLIDEYRAFIVQTKYRLNRVYFHTEFTRSMVANRHFFRKMRRFYSEWRKFLTEILGQHDKYVESYNASEYTFLIDDTIEGSRAKYQTLLPQYYSARNKVFNFFMNEAFRPNHYCILEESTREGVRKHYLEFSTLQERARARVGTRRTFRMTSCFDDFAQDRINEYIAEKIGTSARTRLVGEIGDPLDSSHYSTNSQDHTYPFDILGNRYIKLFATLNLSERAPLSLNNINDFFFPNFLDEADLRHVYQNKILDRAENGVRVDNPAVNEALKQDFFEIYQAQTNERLFSAMGINADTVLEDPAAHWRYEAFSLEQEQLPEGYTTDEFQAVDDWLYNGSAAAVKFERETETVAFQFRLFMAGLFIPGKIEATLERLKPFKTIPTPRYFNRGQRPTLSVDVGRYILTPSPESDESRVAKQVMTTYNLVNFDLEREEVNRAHLQVFMDQVVEAVTAQFANLSSQGIGATYQNYINLLQDLKNNTDSLLENDLINEAEKDFIYRVVDEWFNEVVSANRIAPDGIPSRNAPLTFNFDDEEVNHLQLSQAERVANETLERIGNDLEALSDRQQGERQEIIEVRDRIRALRDTLFNRPLTDVIDHDVTKDHYQRLMDQAVIEHEAAIERVERTRDELDAQVELLRRVIMSM